MRLFESNEPYSENGFPDEPVYVTRPAMPPLDDFQEYLRDIWASRTLTNMGPLHDQLEAQLATYLGVEYLSLMCNGTIALLTALQTLRINGGEVITTPFTFPATAHVLYWNRARPVFCDIKDSDCNIDPDRIERCISPDTKAILAVHTFGLPCDVQALEEIAGRHGLYVIYDAAHAFNVRIGGESILDYGDLSVLSFHATKGFSTVEGGAIRAGTAEQKQRIGLLRNFGIADEETVIGPGINGKMNELQAAFGLATLGRYDAEVTARKEVTMVYRRELADVSGVRILSPGANVTPNYTYLPIRVDRDAFPGGRDGLYDALKRENIHPRKYFYPLCSQYSCYSALPSSSPVNLPIATRAAQEILCLPLYGSLGEETVHRICRTIQEQSTRERLYLRAG